MKKASNNRKGKSRETFHQSYGLVPARTSGPGQQIDGNLLISHYTLRKIIGILGISLPFFVVIVNLLFGAGGIRSSISSYYHSNMQDYFVGVLFAMGFFLIAYRGYERSDNIICTIIGLFGFGVAIFPTKADSLTPTGIFQLAPTLSSYLHLTSAVSFFVLLSYLSYFVFTKSDKNPNEQTERKRMRNHAYRFCGGGVFIATIGVVVSAVTLPDWLQEKCYPVLIFETIALLFFGVAWITKGEAILKDASR